MRRLFGNGVSAARGGRGAQGCHACRWEKACTPGSARHRGGCHPCSPTGPDLPRRYGSCQGSPDARAIRQMLRPDYQPVSTRHGQQCGSGAEAIPAEALARLSGFLSMLQQCSLSCWYLLRRVLGLSAFLTRATLPQTCRHCRPGLRGEHTGSWHPRTRYVTRDRV